jgi:hypothetical protein
MGTGEGRSKKAAEQQAAEAAWMKISASIADDSPPAEANGSPASGSPPAEAGNAPDAPGEGSQGYHPEL